MKYFAAIASLAALLFSAACSQSPAKLVAAGNRYHDKKKYTEAAILYSKAIQKEKTYGEAYYRLGLDELDSGQLIEASRSLRRAIDLQPNNIDAETKLAEIYLAAYTYDRQRLKSLWPDVKDLTDKILKQQPNNFNGLRLQAMIYQIDGDKERALETFAAANKQKPYSPQLVGWYAESLYSSGHEDQAESLIRDMLAHDKTWGPGYDLLFVVESRKKDNTAGAEQVLRDRVNNDPKSALGYQNLANFLLATKRADQGEEVIRRTLKVNTDAANGHALVGDYMLRERRYDAAIQEYAQAAKDDPKRATAYQERMIAAYGEMGKRDEALKLAKNVAEKDAKDSTAANLYAGLVLQTGDARKAIEEIKALLQKNPADVGLKISLARAYYGSGDLDKAYSLGSDALQNEAKAATPRPGMVLAAREVVGRIEADRGQFAKALEQSNAMATLIADSVPAHPDVQRYFVPARLIKARALTGMNELGSAEPELLALEKENPQLEDVHLQLGDLYMLQRQYDKASAEYDLAYQRNPKDIRGFIGLQNVKLAQGHAADAITSLQDLVNKNPSVLAYRYELASYEATTGAQSLQRDPEHGKQLLAQAADNYKQILKTATNSADVWVRLGVLQQQLQQYDAALASFQQASQADPHNGTAPLNEAMLLERMGKKKEAGDAYNKVLGIDPDNALALNNLAFLNAESGQNLDQAMTLAERAKKKVPNNADISDTLGYVYFQKNLNSQALDIFRQVVQENPNNPTFHYHLAMALNKQGDRQAARDEAQKALKASTQPAEQDRIKSLLSQIG